MADNPSGINQVGMGVYLDDGVTTLAQLRAIRQEMEAINRLSGRTPAGTGTGGTRQSQTQSWEQELNAREKAEIASQRRIANARRDAFRSIDADEVETLARAKDRRLQMTEQVNRRAAELTRKRHEEEARLEQRALDQSVRRREAAQQRIARQRLSLAAGVTDVDTIRQQARLFQRYRNDPARGNLDNIFRKQIAEMRLASRPLLQEARRIRREAEYEVGRTFRNESYAHIANAQRRQASAFQQVRQGYTGNIIQAQLNRDAFAYRRSQLQEAMIYRQAGLPLPSSLSQQLGGYQAINYGSRQYNQGLYSGNDPGGYLQRAYGRLGQGGIMPPTRSNRGNIAGSQGFTAAGFQQGGSAALRATGITPSGPSALGITGRITRNILLYEAVSELSYGLVNYISNSIKAAKTTVEFANALRFATQQADGNLAQTQLLADSFLDIGLSRQQGRAAVVEAARFAEGRPQDIEALTRIGADIASARGLGIDRTDELIEQLRRRESKFYKRLFGTTVEAIYEAEAATAIDAQGISPTRTPGLFIGLEPNEIKSRTQAIASYVQAMDDEAKENSVLNYILAQSNRFKGEAAERAETLAGRLDRLSAAWLNSQEGLGLFITDLRIVNDLLEALAGKVSVFDNLRGPEIGRTGYRGSISAFDVEQFGRDRTTGSRANVLSAIDTYGLPLAGTVVALGASALLGRRTALQQSQVRSYFDTLSTAMPRYGGNPYLAAQEAKLVASNARAGVFNSITAGATRLTTGFANTVGGFFGVPNLVGQRAVTPVFGQQYLRDRGPIPTAQGLYSPLISPQFQSRLDQVQGAFGAGGGIVGGLLGATIGSFIAQKIDAGVITTGALTILGGAAGTFGGSLAGDIIGSAIGTRILGAGGFGAAGKGFAASVGSLLTGGVGAAGLLTTTAGVAGAGVLGYGVGSLLAKPVSQTFATPFSAINAILRGGDTTTYADQLLAERFLAQTEAAEPAFRARTRERASAFREDRVRYVSRLEGGATQLLTPEEVGRLTSLGLGRLSDYEERIVSRREARNITQDQLRTRLSNIASRYGTSIDQTYTTLSGEQATRLDGLRTQQAIALRAQEIQREIETAQFFTPDPRDTAGVAEHTKKVTNLRDALSAVTQDQKLFNEALERQTQLLKPGTFIDPLTGEIGGISETFRQNYLADRAQRDAKRESRERQTRDEDTQKINEALSKIRQARENSYQVVGEIGQAITGPDNPYTAVLAEQLTLGERMQRQWGHLGQAAVDYFTKLNNAQLNRQLNRLDFGVQHQAGELREQAAREEARRFGPGLNRAETNRLDIYSAAGQALALFQNNRAQTQGLFGTRFARDIYGDQSFRPYDLAVQGIAETQALFGRGTGFGIGPGPQRAYLGDTLTSLDARSADIYGQFQLARTATRDLSSEAMIQLGGIYAEAFLGNLQGLSEQDLRRLGRAPGFREAYIDAINAQQAAANQRVQDAIRKAQLDAEESDRLTAQLRYDENFRQRQILAGYDPRDVGRESDALFLARTDGIDPKDLSFTQFQQRQEVLKRTAERSEQDRKEAIAATLLGLNYQQQMLFELEAMRTAILGGDVKMLIQVQNDTQARLDKEALELREQTSSLNNYDRR